MTALTRLERAHRVLLGQLVLRDTLSLGPYPFSALAESVAPVMDGDDVAHQLLAWATAGYVDSNEEEPDPLFVITDAGRAEYERLLGDGRR